MYHLSDVIVDNLWPTLAHIYAIDFASWLHDVFNSDIVEIQNTFKHLFDTTVFSLPSALQFNQVAKLVTAEVHFFFRLYFYTKYAQQPHGNAIDNNDDGTQYPQ